MQSCAEGSSQGSAALPALGWWLLRTRHPCEIELVFCCSQVQIKAAKQRVVMASLYLGTGLLEQELVSAEGFGEARKGMQGRGGREARATPGLGLVQSHGTAALLQGIVGLDLSEGTGLVFRVLRRLCETHFMGIYFPWRFS